MKVSIESRRDYELYIKRIVSKLQVSGKHKSVFRKIAMQCFDDGVSYNQNNLEVEVEI